MDFYSQSARESTDFPPSLCLFKCDISSIRSSSCNYLSFYFNLLLQDNSAVLAKPHHGKRIWEKEKIWTEAQWRSRRHLSLITLLPFQMPSIPTCLRMAAPRSRNPRPQQRTRKLGYLSTNLIPIDWAVPRGINYPTFLALPKGGQEKVLMWTVAGLQ